MSRSEGRLIWALLDPIHNFYVPLFHVIAKISLPLDLAVTISIREAVRRPHATRSTPTLAEFCHQSKLITRSIRLWTTTNSWSDARRSSLHVSGVESRYVQPLYRYFDGGREKWPFWPARAIGYPGYPPLTSMRSAERMAPSTSLRLQRYPKDIHSSSWGLSPSQSFVQSHPSHRNQEIRSQTNNITNQIILPNTMKFAFAVVAVTSSVSTPGMRRSILVWIIDFVLAKQHVTDNPSTHRFHSSLPAQNMCGQLWGAGLGPASSRRTPSLLPRHWNHIAVL